jgi:hypothetical protein
VLEASVESVLMSTVKAKKGRALKLQPYVAGIPDRLVLMPGGRAFLVELKRKGEHPTKVQRVMHDRLAEMGHPVKVLRGSDEVREWVSTL